MKKLLLVINSAVGGLLLTAVVAAGTLLYLMFSTGDEVVHKTGLFGAVFFQTTRISGDGLGTEMGVSDPVALLAMALVAGLLIAWVQVVYLVLRAYRSRLIAKGASHP